MTYEEAISSLETLKPIVEWGKPMEYQVALDLGIEALEKADKYRWHNLRKDPEDLPDTPRQVEVYGLNYHYTFGKYARFRVPFRDSEKYFWVKADAWSANEKLSNVIAWREIEPCEREVEE